MVRTAGPAIGSAKADISTLSLRTGDTMALLMAQVDPENIRLVGGVEEQQDAPLLAHDG